MKILHICETIIGGTGSYISEILLHQAEAYGAENIALLIPDSHIRFLDPGIATSGVSIETFSRPTRLSGTVLLPLRYLALCRSFKPDIVHSHSTVAGFVVRLLRPSRSPKVVTCPHGWAFDIENSALLRGFARIVERALARRADKIVVISSHERDRAIEVGLPPERLALVLNGVRAQAPDVEREAWEDERLRVLFVGRFDHQKGLDVLLRAVSPVQDKIAVRLIGDAVVNASAAPSNLPASVEKLGWLSRRDVTAHMKAADLLVVPSRWEGFGLVAIEAMRVGLPVLASRVGGLPEILGGGRFGYLTPPDDAETLRARLLGLDRGKLKEMGAIGRQRFLDAFTIERVNRELHVIYASLL